MKGTQLFKRTVLAGAALACIVAGTIWGQTTPPSSATTEHSVTPPTTAPGGEGVVAIVNGNAISAKWFDDMLMSVAGRRVFPQALDLILVQQACGADGIPMQGKDFQERVQSEIQRALDSFEAQGVAKEDRGRLLATLLQRNGRTEEEFLIAMNVAAGLRSLSKGRVDAPTTAEVEEGFKAQYGAKVKIQLLTIKGMEDAPIVREELTKGDTLEHIATVHQFGLQSMTISENADQPEIKKIKDVAFGLKDHELSTYIPMDINGKSAYYMVYLDENVKAVPGAKLADVKDKVEKSVMGIKEQNWMNAKLRLLQQSAKVDVKDPILLSQYESIKKAQEAATQTQPAPGAATMPK